MKPFISAFAASLLYCMANMVHADAAFERGKQTAAMCSACHQNDGIGMNHKNADSWPRLAGLNADYIAKQLQDFKSGKRENATMKPFASMLSEQQISDVAHYFSQLKVNPIKLTETDQQLYQKGKKLAEQGNWDNYIVPCAKCHGPNDNGNGAHFPAIANQHPDYLAAQLNAFKTGARHNDPQKLMQAIAKRLSSDDIKALSIYLAAKH